MELYELMYLVAAILVAALSLTLCMLWIQEHASRLRCYEMDHAASHHREDLHAEWRERLQFERELKRLSSVPLSRIRDDS